MTITDRLTITKESISEMTNEEIDHAIAIEVMGWKIIHDKNYCESVGAYLYVDKNGNTHFLRYDRPNVYSGEIKFSPSTEFSQTWRVVERMREKKFGFSLVAALTDDTNKNIWMVIFAFGLIVEHESAPRAICEAALMAVRENSNEMP